MPVDIRSFFQKKAPADSSEKSSTSTSHKKASATSKGSKSKDQTASSEKAEHAAKPKRRRQQVAPEDTKEVIDVDDSDKKSKPTASETEPKKVPYSKTAPATRKSSRSSPAKRKRVIIDSADEDDESEADEDYMDDVEVVNTRKNAHPSPTTRRVSPRKAKNQPDKPKEESDGKVDVPASEYSSKSKGGSPTKKMKTSSPVAKTATPTTSPAKKKSPPSSTKSAGKKTNKGDKLMAPEDVEPIESFSVNDAAPECLSGYTFCVTAIDPVWSREDATDFLKGLGARVTTAVSGKTDYLLVLGEILEDDRPYTEGSKYRKAAELNTRVVVGRAMLNGVVRYHSDLKGGPPSPKPLLKAPPPAAVPTAPPVDPLPAAVAASAPTAAASDSATKVVKNPYARKNPYVKKSTTTSSTTANPYAASKKPVAEESKKPVKPLPVNSGTMLWVDKYKPQSTDEILGNQDSVRKLKSWLLRWESTFNKDELIGKAFSNPRGPWKSVLLSGPPGIGSEFLFQRIPAQINTFLTHFLFRRLFFSYRNHHGHVGCRRVGPPCLGI